MANCEWQRIDCPYIISNNCHIKVRADKLLKEATAPEQEVRADAEEKLSVLSDYRCAIEEIRGRDICNEDLTPQEIKHFGSIKFQIGYACRRLISAITI